MSVLPPKDTRDNTSMKIFGYEDVDRQKGSVYSSGPKEVVMREGNANLSAAYGFGRPHEVGVVDADCEPADQEQVDFFSWNTLHEAGHAHSVECWRTDKASGEERLVGGLYGIAIEGAFCGESMFSRERDASKVALAWLVARLKVGGFSLLDCQFMTDHLASLGAIEMGQGDYVKSVAAAAGEPKMSLPEAYVSLVSAAGSRAAGAAGGGAGAGATGAALGTGAGASSPGKVILHSLTQTS